VKLVISDAHEGLKAAIRRVFAARLWGLMHKQITHNKCHETFRDFSDAILTFLREEVPRNWRLYCDDVTDNFRIISSKDFRFLA